VAPTIGFRNVKFTFDAYDITLYDIGGGKNIRPVWKTYFPDVYGVIYMVDSSSADRMDDARETLRDALEHPSISGKPVLL
jgi:ADP-ribosylation factor-like protein 13B